MRWLTISPNYYTNVITSYRYLTRNTHITDLIKFWMYEKKKSHEYNYLVLE